MAELSAAQVASNVPRITRAARTVPAPEPPAEEDGMVMSAAKSVGSGIMSGLSMVGNLLDLPRSMVDDVLVGDNPFDQFADPLSHSDTGRSASGRDTLARNVLTSWLFTPNKETGMSGWVDDPLEGVQDVLGFGFELATDPLSWFTGGVSKVPGFLGDLSKAVTTPAKAGKLGKLAKGLEVANELDPGTHVGRALGIPQALAARNLAKANAATKAAGEAVRPFTASTATVDDFVRDTISGVIPKDGSPLSKEYEQFAANHAAEINDAFRRAADPLANPAAAAPSQPVTPDAPNQVTDSILDRTSSEAPLSGGVAGTLDRLGDTLTSLDPGTHVGKFVRGQLGSLASKLNIHDLVDQHVTQKILNSQYGQKAVSKVSQIRDALRPPGMQLPASKGGAPAFGLTEQQELAGFINSGFASRGSRILKNLNQSQDLARRVGDAFGAKVLFWGGGKDTSKANGVRRGDVGNRIWVAGDAGESAHNNIVGHELVHLIREVDTSAFDKIVDTIIKNTPADYLQGKTDEYVRDFKAALGRDLAPGLHIEEGTARSVQAAFDRPAFWQELTTDPKMELQVRNAFNQAMAKLKGKLPEPEFEILDQELSKFIFSKAEDVRGGATLETIKAANADRFMSTSPSLADVLAAPGTRTHNTVSAAAELGSRIKARINQAMNYKVGDHVYPVVQDFSKQKINTLEAMAANVRLPAVSVAQTMSRLVDSLPDDFYKTIVASDPSSIAHSKFTELDNLVVKAIEKGDYSVLPRELHPAVRQLEIAQRELKKQGILSGLDLSELRDSYVNYYPHTIDPRIAAKFKETKRASANKSAADLGVSVTSVDSGRTGMLREAYGGRETWNSATTDPVALDILSDETTRVSDRVNFAADHLREQFIDDIDPRIPVMRDNKFVMLQKMPDGSLSPILVPAKEIDSFQRVDYTIAPDGSKVPIDFNNAATRTDHHANKPIEYIKKVTDANGNEVELEFEMLTGRKDGRYGDTSNPDDMANYGFYKNADEQRDRYQVLAEFMSDVGTDTLKETGGVFGGSAVHNWAQTMNTKAGQVATVQAMPRFLLSAMQQGYIAPATKDSGQAGKQLRLKNLFDTSYFSVVDRQTVFQQLATLDPSLKHLADNTSAKQFTQMMNDMVLAPEIYDDLLQVGRYMRGNTATDFLSKGARSVGSVWKAGVLTHPAFHNRNLMSGLAQLVYGNLFSHSAANTARNVLYNQPSPELLHYGPIKEYLNRFEMEHTPENATEAARVMFANFMQESGNIYSDYTDPANPIANAAKGVESFLEAMPGDGRTGFLDLLKGAAKTAIGREGDTTWNPFDVSGVQHLFDKTDKATGKITAKAGDVRTETKFAPVAGSNIVGKHVNDVTRMAGWLEGMRRGNSARGAWKAVDFNQINYNPSKFGPIEAKVLKQIFPFYSFMSRETAWVAHELLTNPAGRLGKIIRLSRHANSTNKNEYLPEHIAEGISIPVGGHRTDGVQQYLTGLGFMFEDPLKMAGNALNSSQDISRDLLSKSNPLIKGVAEWGLGRSSFQGGPMGGRDIEDMDPVLGRIFTQLGLQAEKEGGQAAPAFGSRGLEFVLSNSPVSRILSSSKTLLDDRKGVLSRASNVLSGIKVTSVSPEQRQRGLREILNARAKELGARPFTTLHISKSMLEAAKANEANDPETYQEMLLISNKRKQLDKLQRIKRKAAIAEK